MLLFDASIDQGIYSFQFDAIQLTREPSALGDFSYMPIHFTRAETIHVTHRLVLTFGALILGSLQNSSPTLGIIVHGRDCKRTTVRLEPYRRKVSRVLAELQELGNAKWMPGRVLNDHCRQCPFADECRKAAVADDDLSLLDRLNEKEIARLHRKGIFTVTQLSYTFRPRKRNKRVKSTVSPFSPALKALAIRENTVFVCSRPQLPDGNTRVYVDIEGDPNGAFVYLIGLIVVHDNEERSYSFWANTKLTNKRCLATFST